MSTVTAILLALFYALLLGPTPAFSACFPLSFLCRWPIMCGTIVGIIMGDPITGMAMGATINLMYLGVISVGGEVPSDSCLAAFAGTALGIASGLDVEAAVALAVPFGVVGASIPTIFRSLNVFFMHKAQESANKGRKRAMRGWFFCTIPVRAVILFVVIFIGLSLGSEAMSAAVGAMPVWMLNGLAEIGQVLPALGLALGIATVVKRTEQLVYFVAAILISLYLGVPIVFITAAAVLIAWYKIATLYRRDREENAQETAPEISENVKKQRLLKKKDLTGYALMHQMFSQSLNNYEDMHGTGKAVMISYLMEKLYPGDTEKQLARVKTHFTYFNSNPCLEMLIFGMVAAMEEEIALGYEVQDEDIIAVKTGLMGPLAGVGDSITQGVLIPIVCTIGIALVQQGNAMGPVVTLIGLIVMAFILPLILFYAGYKGGNTILDKLLSSNMMSYVSEGGAIVALAAFGALAASTITAQIAWIVPTTEITIQSILDNLMLGIIPLTLTLVVYGRLKKGVKTTRILLILFICAFLLGAVGILA